MSMICFSLFPAKCSKMVIS